MSLIKDSQKSTCNSVHVSIAVAWRIYTIDVYAKSLQLCLTLCDPMDYSLPGSSVHAILQARILEWVAVSFSRGSSQPRDQTCVSCISWHWQVILYCWATRDAQSNYTPKKITLKKEVNMQCFQASFLSFFLFVLAVELLVTLRLSWNAHIGQISAGSRLVVTPDFMSSFPRIWSLQDSAGQFGNYDTNRLLWLSTRINWSPEEWCAGSKTLGF